MSINSMTGFGRGTASARGLQVVVELKSVNHKQFDCRLDLPSAWGAAEIILRKQIQARLARGYISGRISLPGPARLCVSLAAVDDKLAQRYLQRLRAVAARLGMKDDLSASALLKMPQVVRLLEPPAQVPLCRALAKTALERALRALLAMRAREGRALARDLRRRLLTLHRLAERIARRAPTVARAYRLALRRRIRESRLKIKLDDPRLIKEVALYADRADIAEELTRLHSHLQQWTTIMAGGGAVGRTLDFLAQELWREINTIGSKANDSRIAEHVIQFKTELERLREQVQNIE